MSDFNNDAKRKPWTHDPEVLKEIWGENAQISAKPPTASERLVNQKGSLWPTADELQAYGANALPDSQTYGRAPLSISEPLSKPMHNTSILSPIDSTQSIIDSVLATKSTTKAAKKAVEIEIEADGEEDEEGDGEEVELKGKGKGKGKTSKKEYSEALVIEYQPSPIAVRMKEAKARMQDIIDRGKA